MAKPRARTAEGLAAATAAPHRAIKARAKAPLGKAARRFVLEQLDHAARGGAYLEARHSFRRFRTFKRPGILTNWFTDDLAVELQAFYVELMRGLRPKLAIEAPPQHGKSWAVQDFIGWFSGKHPDRRTIFASFSDGLGEIANRDLYRTIKDGAAYRHIFPDLRIDVPGWTCNNNHIEFVQKGGSFRNTTVEGPINGFGLHLGVIDDPHKNRDEANRKTARDKVWNWFTDDFFPRFDQSAGLLLIQTRWHVDDVLGRFIAKFGERSANNPEGVRVLRYPAVAEVDSQYRAKGEALFPAHKPIDFLLERKKLMSQASFEAEYQQHPIIVGGGMLPIEKLKTVKVFEPSKILASVRAWDKAISTNDDAAYTAGVLMHKMKDHVPEYVIEHIARGRWGVYEREQRIKALAQADAARLKNYEIVVEMEPGSGGKESAEATIRNLAGFRVLAERPTGSKEARAEPFVAQVQGGNVGLHAGDFVLSFLDEAEAWPFSRTLDQIDAAAHAFNRLVKGTAYNTDYKAWAF